MSAIGVPGVVLIIILALLLFGPSKLPELGKAVGRTLREFKNGTRDIMENDPVKVVTEYNDQGKTTRTSDTE